MKNSAKLGNAQRNGVRSPTCAVRAARGQVGRGGAGADIAFRSEFSHSRRARTTTNNLDKPVPHSRISSTVYAGSLYGRSPVRHRLRAQSSRRTMIRANPKKPARPNPPTPRVPGGFVFGSLHRIVWFARRPPHGTADLILISGHVSGASCVRERRARARRRTCGYGFR